MMHFCVQHGIEMELSNTCLPSENGVVEQDYEMLVEMARMMQEHKSLYTLKKSLSNVVLGRTPFEAYYGKKPIVSHLSGVHDSDAYVHVPKA